MKQYCINRIPNKDGFNVLHTRGCFRCFFASNIMNLGYFKTCEYAVKEAEKYFEKVLPCQYCLPNCPTKKEKPYEPNKELFE